MADHTCNANISSETKDLVRSEPGGQKTYLITHRRTCDVCGKLASEVTTTSVEG